MLNYFPVRYHAFPSVTFTICIVFEEDVKYCNVALSHVNANPLIQKIKSWFLFKSATVHCEVALIKKDGECEGDYFFFKFLKTCLSCFVVLPSSHQPHADQVFPNQNQID